jgi:hypothetical protein
VNARLRMRANPIIVFANLSSPIKHLLHAVIFK